MIEGIFIDEDAEPTTTTTTTIVSNIVGVNDDDCYAFVSTTTQFSYDLADKSDNKTAKYYCCLLSIEFYKEHPLLLLRRSFYLDFQKAYVSTSYSSSSTTLQVQ